MTPRPIALSLFLPLRSLAHQRQGVPYRSPELQVAVTVAAAPVAVAAADRGMQGVFKMRYGNSRAQTYLGYSKKSCLLLG